MPFQFFFLPRTLQKHVILQLLKDNDSKTLQTLGRTSKSTRRLLENFNEALIIGKVKQLLVRGPAIEIFNLMKVHKEWRHIITMLLEEYSEQVIADIERAKGDYARNFKGDDRNIRASLAVDNWAILALRYGQNPIALELIDQLLKAPDFNPISDSSFHQSAEEDLFKMVLIMLEAGRKDKAAFLLHLILTKLPHILDITLPPRSTNLSTSPYQKDFLLLFLDVLPLSFNYRMIMLSFVEALNVFEQRFGNDPELDKKMFTLFIKGLFLLKTPITESIKSSLGPIINELLEETSSNLTIDNLQPSDYTMITIKLFEREMSSFFAFGDFSLIITIAEATVQQLERREEEYNTSSLEEILEHNRILIEAYFGYLQAFIKNPILLSYYSEAQKKILFNTFITCIKYSLNKRDPYQRIDYSLVEDYLQLLPILQRKLSPTDAEICETLTQQFERVKELLQTKNWLPEEPFQALIEGANSMAPPKLKK